MTLRIVGDLHNALELVRGAVAKAEWRAVEGSPGGPMGLLPQESTGAAEDYAWLMLAPNGSSVSVTVWLPEAVPATACGALEAALDEVADGGDESGERALLRRLRRIEGQIRGLQRMIESRRECDAILTQFSAVASALKQTAAHLVSAHLVQCVRDAVDRGGEMDEINQRLLSVLF